MSTVLLRDRQKFLVVIAQIHTEGPMGDHAGIQNSPYEHGDRRRVWGCDKTRGKTSTNEI